MILSIPKCISAAPSKAYPGCGADGLAEGCWSLRKSPRIIQKIFNAIIRSLITPTTDSHPGKALLGADTVYTEL